MPFSSKTSVSQPRSGARSRAAASATVALALTALGALHAAAAQEIARLYAARAPAGSAYVRVVNPTTQALRLDFGGKTESLDGARRAASDYRIVDAAAPMSIKVNGKALPALALTAGSFNTVIVGAGKAQLVADATDSRNDLKAELRFYNLAAGCDASLALQNGALVFEHIAAAGNAKRNINPVQAALVGSCAGAGSSAAVALPTLKSGDHVSLFLFGDAAKPRLHVQADATEAYTGAR